MALTSANVRSAVTGELSVGPTSTTAPTGTGTALTGFTGLGYVSSDGVTESRSRDTNDINAWQNGALVRSNVTGGSLTYQLTLIETSKAVIETALGVTITQSSTEGTYVINPTSTGGRKSFVLDIVDGGFLKRIYLSQAEVTDVGDTTYTNGDPIGYDITITAYFDSTIGGNAKVWDTALKTGA